MLVELKKLFLRDLNRLETELKLYPSDDILWLCPDGISNPAGTLGLHLVGNLRHFIGAVIGDTGYVRNRTAEFEDRNTPVSAILDMITLTKTEVSKVLSQLSEDQMKAGYPLEVFGEPMTYGEFLIHLQGHLNYHLGQINYHRRLLS